MELVGGPLKFVFIFVIKKLEFVQQLTSAIVVTTDVELECRLGILFNINKSRSAPDEHVRYPRQYISTI